MRFYLAVAFAISSALGQNPNSDAADNAIFISICGSCHGTTLVEGLRTELEWREEINQMIKIGARATPAQLRSVMRVLARTLTKVNVNSAEPAQISPVLDLSDEVAQALVKRRTLAGKFKTLEDLKLIPGVDPEKLEARRNRIMF